jgi:hypothetical protein
VTEILESAMEARMAEAATEATVESVIAMDMAKAIDEEE